MQKRLNKIAIDTNNFLKKYLKKENKTDLIKPMSYGLFSGGKKIRSKIIYDIGCIFKINYRSVIHIGAAVECIHAYSLIHDDLPCMDDDDFRRGKLSTHKKLTVKQNLIVFGKLYKIKNLNDRIDYLISKLRLGDILNRITGELSSGQKNRASLAKSLINDPKVLLLDEPTASLDPEIGDFIRSFLEDYKKEKKISILLASHNMNEVTRLCKSILMMKDGIIVDSGSPANLIEKHGRKNLEEVFLKLSRRPNEHN